MAAIEGGVRIARQVPGWTAEEWVQGAGCERAETKVGEQGSGAGCGMGKKRLFNLG